MLPDEKDRTYGAHFSEPSGPLNRESFTPFQEEMTGVVSTDPWNISPYLHAIAIVHQRKDQWPFLC